LCDPYALFDQVFFGIESRLLSNPPSASPVGEYYSPIVSVVLISNKSCTWLEGSTPAYNRLEDHPQTNWRWLRCSTACIWVHQFIGRGAWDSVSCQPWNLSMRLRKP